MSVHSPLLGLPRPGAPWTDSKVLVVPIELPAAAVPQIEWLSGRWSLEFATIASDILVAATSGRYVLAQLTSHRLQPQQPPRVPGTEVLSLSLLSESAHRLRLAAARLRTNAAAAGGMLILGHLEGQRLLPLTDPVTAKLEGDLPMRDDASWTIWLPEGLHDKIDALASHQELTKSDVIRNGLLLHAVGRTQFERWTSEGSWRPKRKASRDELQAFRAGDVRFSRGRPPPSADGDAATQPSPPPSPGRRADFIRQHGKSEMATRVFLPTWLKSRLEALAGQARLPASEYGRRVLSTLI